jgi:hypothetical protein
MMRSSQFGDQLFLTELYFLKIETPLDNGVSFEGRLDLQQYGVAFWWRTGRERRFEAAAR